MRRILFTQWFRATPEIQSYNAYCLYKNLCNPAIESVVLFIDDPHFQNIYGGKLVCVPWGRRLSYNDWFAYSWQHYPQDIKILINSDVYLNETLRRADLLEWHNTFHILSRRDIAKNGAIQRSRVYYGGEKLCHPKWSQDCWLYRDQLPPLCETIYLGVMHCENKMRVALQKSGVQVQNITGRMDCFHVDWRETKPRNIADYEFGPDERGVDYPPYQFSGDEDEFRPLAK